jgi:hypothetical protein
MSANLSARTPAQIEAHKRRQAAIARAKGLGLPMIGRLEEILARVEIMEKHPRSWSEQDLRNISPYLAIHQDLRPGSADRVESIMRNGLQRGMVDDLDPMVTGRGWSWAKRLAGGNAYIFCRGVLRYKGNTGWLAAGNMPAFMLRTERGQPVLEALKTAVTREDALLDEIESLDDQLPIQRCRQA